MKKIAVLTSGGDAPGMNAAVRSVVRYSLNKGIEVFGIHRGYHGLLHGEIEILNRNSVSDVIDRGGTFLKTARCLEFKQEEVRRQAYEILKEREIQGLIVVGGDGSFMGAKLLSKFGLSTVGIPGTIDNDLPYTDYTIGFDTALNTILDSVRKLRDTSSSHERVSIVEVMGRNCGDLALYSALAGGAEAVIVPEYPFNREELCERILEGKKSNKLHSLIILAEGAGNAEDLRKYIQQKIGLDTRATVLGHIQRGGIPTGRDRVMASVMGRRAVDILCENKNCARVVGIRDNLVFDMDIEEALKMERNFNKDLYDLVNKLV